MNLDLQRVDTQNAADWQAEDDPGTDGLTWNVVLRRWIQSDEQTWSSPSVTKDSCNTGMSNMAARIWVILDGVIELDSLTVLEETVE